MRPKQSISERFFSKVEKRRSGCWEWTACHLPNGYGAFQLNGKEGAHRVSWRIHFGDIPSGLFVCHRCDNKRCVNPEHLFLGSPSDNMVDKVSKGRQACTAGENNGSAKLTEEDVIAIRASSEVQTAAARRFGVSRAAIGLVRQRKTWAHVA